WHGLTLYEEQIHVPLMIKWSRHEKGPEPGAEAGLARLIDVAPTLLAAAGLAIPESMQGTDLRRPFAARAEKDRQVFSEEDHEGNVLWSLLTTDEKLIVANEGNPRGLPPRAYFDVANDPKETDPYSDPDAEARLEELARLQRLAAEGRAVKDSAATMTREDCERLRVLGYVESCEDVQ